MKQDQPSMTVAFCESCNRETPHCAANGRDICAYINHHRGYTVLSDKLTIRQLLGGAEQPDDKLRDDYAPHRLVGASSVEILSRLYGYTTRE